MFPDIPAYPVPTRLRKEGHRGVRAFGNGPVPTARTDAHPASGCRRREPMKKSLPWILLGVSVVLNAFFVVGYVHSQIQHARIHSERGARSLMVERPGLTEDQRENGRATGRERVC